MFKMLSINGMALILPFHKMQTDSANQIPVLSEVWECRLDEIAEMGNVARLCLIKLIFHATPHCIALKSHNRAGHSHGSLQHNHLSKCLFNTPTETKTQTEVVRCLVARWGRKLDEIGVNWVVQVELPLPAVLLMFCHSILHLTRICMQGPRIPRYQPRPELLECLIPVEPDFWDTLYIWHDGTEFQFP